MLPPSGSAVGEGTHSPCGQFADVPLHSESLAPTQSCHLETRGISGGHTAPSSSLTTSVSLFAFNAPQHVDSSLVMKDSFVEPTKVFQ